MTEANNNWSQRIERVRAALARLNSADDCNPNPPASRRQVIAAEAKLGLVLPDDYKMFLQHANGWPNMHIWRLFSAEQIAERPRESFLHEEGPREYLETIAVRPEDVLIVGDCEFTVTLFLYVLDTSRSLPGYFLDWQHEEYFRSNSFSGFFEYLTDMLEQLSRPAG